MQQTREDAWRLLNQYTKNPALVKHALAVEAAMRAYALKDGADPDRWGMTGLLHDFDYESFPNEHPMKGAGILEELGYPEDLVHAIRAHANFTGVPRRSSLDRTLFAVDELCGLITAATLVRPGKKIADLPASSVVRRMKDKAFARSVSREDIRQGADELGVELANHIHFVIQAMAAVAEDLGLAGAESGEE